MARYYQRSYLDYFYDFSLPLHLCFFMLILFSVFGFTWYVNYESVIEDFVNQVKLLLMLSPIFLLLLLRIFSDGFPYFVALPERDSLHRAGGSPWGVALLLVLVLFMVSHHSSLHERWFPLIAK